MSAPNHTAQTTTIHEHIRVGIGNGRGHCIRGSEINVHEMCIKCTFHIHSMHIQCTFKVYAGSMFKLELDDVVVWVALAGGG